MFTIEDLRKGKCAVKNDGTAEELKEVLELTFLGSTVTVGLYKFYYACGDDWRCNDSTNLPTQSVKDFLSKKLKRGDLVWVSDYDPEERIVKLIFLTEIKGSIEPFVCVRATDTDNFRSGEPFNTMPYKYATKVEEPIAPEETVMSIKEIEEALNIKNLKVVK